MDVGKRIASLVTLRFSRRLIRATSRLHLAIYRRSAGSGPTDADTLILTTRGRSSGLPHSTPLYYVEDQGRKYVAASFAGSDEHPDWYLNLRADPVVTVELKGVSSPHRVRELSEDEAIERWPSMLALYPTYSRYQKRTNRRIPLIELTPEP